MVVTLAGQSVDTVVAWLAQRDGQKSARVILR
jgi:hypothetical protein